MATNQTTNFSLPKWEKTDRIMMSDFNDLTEKLDTALAGRMGGFEQIRTVAATQSVQTLTLDLAGVDWGKWNFVFAVLRPVKATSSVTTLDFYTNGAARTDAGGTADTAFHARVLLFFPFRDANRPAHHVCFPNGNTIFSSSPCSCVTGVQANTNGALGLAVGTTITLYGIR